MGPIFQIILFVILYGLLSIIIGSGLALVFWMILKVRNVKGAKSVVYQGFFYPFKLVPYLFAAVIASVFICEGVRGVDAPFTDYWSIPVDDRVQILAIDTMDDWSFSPVGGGEAISGSIRSIGASNDVVYGVTDNGFNYIYDIANQSYIEYEDKSEFETRVSDFGVVDAKLTITPGEYYRDLRVFGDVILIILILIYPAYSFYRLVLNLKNAT